MAEYFRRRAVAAAAGVGVIGLVGIFVLAGDASYLFDGLTSRALPLVILSALCGLGALVLLVRNAPRGARLFAVIAVASVVGSRGMFHLDLRENLLWRYRGPDDDVRVPLDADAGLYDCQGPIDALVEAGMGRPFANNSPGELGARTVEILEAAYRSAGSGVLEQVRQH